MLKDEFKLKIYIFVSKQFYINKSKEKTNGKSPQIKHTTLASLSVKYS